MVQNKVRLTKRVIYMKLQRHQFKSNANEAPSSITPEQGEKKPLRLRHRATYRNAYMYTYGMTETLRKAINTNEYASALLQHIFAS